MTTWWNKNVKERMSDFKFWIGNHNKPSKIYCRKHIANEQYKSVIDCGCGLATEYYGFKKDNYDINYTGLDSCKYLVDLNRTHGITMIEAELNKDLEIPDTSYEVVYCRAVLEHLPYYEKCLNEFIRIGAKEVVVVWFIIPGDEPDYINYWDIEDLYHNKYNREKINQLLIANPKVESFYWQNVVDERTPEEIANDKSFVDNECVLHVLLKKN